METIEARIRAINDKAVDRDQIKEPALSRIVEAIRKFRPTREESSYQLTDKRPILREIVSEAWIADQEGRDIVMHLRQWRVWRNVLDPKKGGRKEVRRGVRKVSRRRTPDNFVVADEPPEKPILTMDDAFDNVPDEFVLLDGVVCSKCKKSFHEYYVRDGICFECVSAGGFDKDERLRLALDVPMWLWKNDCLTDKQFRAIAIHLTRQVGKPGDGKTMTGGEASNIEELAAWFLGPDGKPITRQSIEERLSAFGFAAKITDDIRNMLSEAFPSEKRSEKALRRVDSVRDWLFLGKNRPTFLDLEVLQRQTLNEKLDILRKKNRKKFAQLPARLRLANRGVYNEGRRFLEKLQDCAPPVWPDSTHLKPLDDVYDDFESDPS